MKHRHPLSVIVFLTLLAGLVACQSVVDFVAHSGDHAFTWPLPPEPARLHYDGSLDLTTGLSAPFDAIVDYSSIPSFQLIPVRVDVKNDLLAFIDDQQGRVHVFNRMTRSSLTLKDEGNKELSGVKDIAIDSWSRVYAIDTRRGRVAIYASDGRFISDFGSNFYWSKPERITVDSIRSRLYVADTFHSRIYAFSLEGAFLYMFGQSGNKNGEFAGIADMSVDARGNLHVLEAINLRIQQFSSRGQWTGTIQLDDSNIREPRALAIEEDGSMYIADAYSDELSVLSKSGERLLVIGGYGRTQVKFKGLSDVSFDEDGQRFYTSETGFARIQHFRRTPIPWGKAP